MSLAPRLAYLADVRLGRQRSPEHHAGEWMTPYLRSANVAPAALLLDDVKEMNFPPHDRRIFALQAGDIVVTEGSGSREAVGATAMWMGELAGLVCFQNTLLRVRPREGAVPRFVYWWLQQAYANGTLAEAAGGQSILHIGAEALADLRVHLPEVDEQRRIADFLDDQTTRIGQVIAARQQQIELILEQGRASVVAVLLGGGELSEDPTSAWYRGLPDSWQVRALRSEWTVIDCKHRTPTYLDYGYPVVSPGDVTPGRLDLSGCQRFVAESDYLDLADDLRRCRTGDIVYSRNASAGTAAYVETTAPFTMGQDVCRITSGRPDQKYLFHVLNHVVEPQLESARIGSTITRINVDQIKSLRIPVPGDSDQQVLADEVDLMVTETERGLQAQQHQIDLLQELKRSLVSATVSGEFDVATASERGPM